MGRAAHLALRSLSALRKVRRVGGSFRYRLIDMAGSELGIVEAPSEDVAIGDEIELPDGRLAPVVDIYDDEHGQEGGVRATLVVDEGS